MRSTVGGGHLNFKQRVRSAFSRVEDVLLHFGKEETSKLGAVVHDEVLFMLTGIREDGD